MDTDRVDWFWKLFVVMLASRIVWANISTAEEMNLATFIYRRKPDTSFYVRCARNQTILCTRQRIACAAVHVGRNYYVTTAHCLVDPSGKLHNPRELFIYGLGYVDVEFALHKALNQSWGVNVAWILIKEPKLQKQRTTLNVSNLLPHHCVRYDLELLRTKSTNPRDHFRWHKMDETPHPTARYEILTSYRDTLAFVYPPDQMVRKGWEHVVMCSTEENKNLYELHFIFFGVYNETTTVDLDCRRAQCGKFLYPDAEQVVLPYFVDYYYYYPEQKPVIKTMPGIKQYIPPKPELDYDILSPYEYIYYYVLFNNITSSVPPTQTSLPADPSPEIIPSAIRPQATPPTVEKTTKLELEPFREVEDNFPYKFDYIDDSSKPFTPKTPSKDCNVCCRRFISYRCRC